MDTNSKATEIAGNILNQSMGVKWEKIEGRTSLLERLPTGEPRPLYNVVKSYELVPYGRIKRDNDPILPRTYSWDLLVHIDSAQTMGNAMIKTIGDNDDNDFGLGSIVAYEKHVGALQDIAKGIIGETQRTIIRQSAKLVHHFLHERESSIKSTQEDYIFFVGLAAKANGDEKAKMQERVHHIKNDLTSAQIVVETLKTKILPLYEQLGEALGFSLNMSEKPPNSRSR